MKFRLSGSSWFRSVVIGCKQADTAGVASAETAQNRPVAAPRKIISGAQHLILEISRRNSMTGWESYELVARYLLEKFASEFGLSAVEAKQAVEGRSGTKWEVDAKGVLADGESFLIVECKRWGSRIDQATTASLAYQITDTGASGGIIVSPLGLQDGAKKVAAAEQIVEVTLHPESSYTDYFISFMEKGFAGMRVELPQIGITEVRAKVRQRIAVNVGIGIMGFRSKITYSDD
ncbi:restriction endonuclease [Pseudomonas sp. NPDC087697]|uniref:restriction endonuclease n=1 Tax=Pseudomonas sp. NPDC087697 TaxID=3364447 RepID=UPI00381AB188